MDVTRQGHAGTQRESTKATAVECEGEANTRWVVGLREGGMVLRLTIMLTHFGGGI